MYKRGLPILVGAAYPGQGCQFINSNSLWGMGHYFLDKQNLLDVAGSYFLDRPYSLPKRLRWVTQKMPQFHAVTSKYSVLGLMTLPIDKISQFAVLS